MADTYGALPSFADGQVLSANAHLNPLQDYITAMMNDELGVVMPFTGHSYGAYDLDSSRNFKSYVRHKTDTLYYSVEITAIGLGPSYLKVNGNTVATFPAATNYTSGTGGLNISSLGLTVDEFYLVEMDNDTNQNLAIVWTVFEMRNFILPSLPDFDDGDTPTAANWQTLSAYAATLSTGLQRPYPTGIIKIGATIGDAYGVIENRCRYINYKVSLRRPHGGTTGSNRTYFELFINGTKAMRLQVDDDDGGAASGSEYYRGEVASEYTFEGGTTHLLDLDTYPGSLTLGTIYSYYYTVTSSTPDWGADATVHYFYLVPETAATTSGWVPFVAWDHGDYIYGSTSSPKIQTITNNLSEFYGVVFYVNPVAAAQPEGATQRFGKRRWRWLHYKTNDDGSTPGLSFTYRGQEQNMTLPHAWDNWLALDMDSVTGLWPGTDYVLDNVWCAMEDLTS